jgi:hypothetical protein
VTSTRRPDFVRCHFLWQVTSEILSLVGRVIGPSCRTVESSAAVFIAVFIFVISAATNGGRFLHWPLPIEPPNTLQNLRRIPLHERRRVCGTLRRPSRLGTIFLRGGLAKLVFNPTYPNTLPLPAPSMPASWCSPRSSAHDTAA